MQKEPQRLICICHFMRLGEYMYCEIKYHAQQHNALSLVSGLPFCSVKNNPHQALPLPLRALTGVHVFFSTCWVPITCSRTMWIIIPTVQQKIVYVPYFAEWPMLSCLPSPASVTSFPFNDCKIFAWYVRQYLTMVGKRRCLDGSNMLVDGIQADPNA